MKAYAFWLVLVACASSMFASPTGDAFGGGIARCHANQLHLTAGAYGEAALQFTQTLTLSNISPRACQLAGWPSVRTRDTLGRLASVRVVRVVQGPPNARPFRVVALRPGGAASFNVYGADWNATANRPCGKTSALLITPPGDRTALEVHVRLPSCGVLYVAPLIRGRRDRDAWSQVWKP
jgi:hypothetical protein